MIDTVQVELASIFSSSVIDNGGNITQRVRLIERAMTIEQNVG